MITLSFMYAGIAKSFEIPIEKLTEALDGLFHNIEVPAVYDSQGMWVRFLSPMYDEEGTLISRGHWIRSEFDRNHWLSE